VAVFLTFLVRDKAKGQHPSKKSVSFFTYLKYWNIADANYKKLVIGLLAFTLFNSSDAFLLLVLKEKGFSDVAMIGFYIFYNLCYALLSYPVGILADKIGLKRVLVAGMLLFVVVYGAISFASGIVFLGLIFSVYGIYASATEGVSKALITNLSDKNDTATAIGFYSSFSSVFALLASSLGGFIWFTFSPKAMFLLSAVSVLLVVIYFIVIFGRKE
jgi:Arabinose efflux permease